MLRPPEDIDWTKRESLDYIRGDRWADFVVGITVSSNVECAGKFLADAWLEFMQTPPQPGSITPSISFSEQEHNDIERALLMRPRFS